MTEPLLPANTANRSWRRALLLPGLFFIGGIGATGWFLTSTETGSNLVAPAPAPIAVDPARISAPAGTVSPDIGARIADLEMRLARAEAAPALSGGASAASDRATGLVIAFAARRALERGQPLGPIEAELRSHFGTSAPHLIAAIVAAAERPITLNQLRTEFDTLSPSLSAGNDGWWARLTSLVSVRDATQSPADTVALLKQAKAALDVDRVSVALEAVAKLPGRASASGWMELAKRYVAADAALNELEASAFKGKASPVPVATPPIVLPEPDPTGTAPAPTF